MPQVRSLDGVFPKDLLSRLASSYLRAEGWGKPATAVACTLTPRRSAECAVAPVTCARREEINLPTIDAKQQTTGRHGGTQPLARCVAFRVALLLEWGECPLICLL